MGEDSNKLITSKISQIEKQLADLNVEKQKKEDNIKSTINNIFNENKTENSKNVNFETKNTILNMVLSDEKTNAVEAKEPEKYIEKENTPKEEVVKEEEKFSSAPKEEVIKEEKFSSAPKEEVIKEEKDFLSAPKEEVVKEEVSDVPIKESSNTNQNPISNIEKVDNSSVPSKYEEKSKEKEGGNNIASLSEEMRKGFESVLNAIQGINKRSSEQQKEKPQESSETPKQPQPQGASDVQDKPKTPQKNYIEEYRESLRSNAPINGFVGIKGLELKANNIGSYL